MSWKVPLFDTDFGSAEADAVRRPIQVGWLTMGEEVLALEAELRDATGAKHAIATSNCTIGIQLACAALGVGPGDEVIVPSLTFAATANAPRSLGADIRLVGVVGADDLTIDPEAVARAITPRTKAIIPMHYAGFAADMEALREVAGGLPLVEDAAHAVFTRRDDVTLGLHGEVGCYSFYSNKNITCGEGGAVVTDNDDLAERIRLLRSHGMTTPTLDRHKGRAVGYDVVLAGFNGRLDEIRAALLRTQLSRLPEFLKGRRRAFRIYTELLEGSRVGVPFTKGRFAADLDDTGVHIMAVILPPGTDRAMVMAALAEKRIQSSIHYPPLNSFAMYRDDSSELAETMDLAARQLTLPLYPTIADEDIELVVSTLLRVVA